ncbi:hypothetical protein LTR15_005962 [Elasticomyces elasticus]|nr:hypothetical protein LTR15_005962 [Elasticomyces elasticus]
MSPGNWTGGINANQPRVARLCRDHDQAWWYNVATDAQAEIEVRFRMQFRKKPTRIGSKRPKKGTPRSELTPLQRRAQMKWTTGRSTYSEQDILAVTTSSTFNEVYNIIPASASTLAIAETQENMSNTERAGERAIVATHQSSELSATEDVGNSTTVPGIPQQVRHDASIITSHRLQIGDRVWVESERYVNAPGRLPLLWGYTEQESRTVVAMRAMPVAPGENVLNDIPAHERAPPLVIEHAQILLHNTPEIVPLTVSRILGNAAAGLPSWFGMTSEEIAAAQNDVRDLAEVLNSSLDVLLHIMNWRTEELTGEPHPRGPLDPNRGTVAWQVNDRSPRGGEPVRRIGGPASGTDNLDEFVQEVRERQGAPVARFQDVGETAGSPGRGGIGLSYEYRLSSPHTSRTATPQPQEESDAARIAIEEPRGEVTESEYWRSRTELEAGSGLDYIEGDRADWPMLARRLLSNLRANEWLDISQALISIAVGDTIFATSRRDEREDLLRDLAEFARSHPGNQIVPLVFQSFLPEEDLELRREEDRAHDDAYAERRARREDARDLGIRRAGFDTHQYEAVVQAHEEQISRFLVDLITSVDAASDPDAPDPTEPRTLLMRLGEGGDLVEMEISEIAEGSLSRQRGYRTDAELVQDDEAAEDGIELMGIEMGINDLQGLSLSVDIEAMVEAHNELLLEDRLYGPGVDWWRQ